MAAKIPKDFGIVKDRVADILLKYPECRESDNLLILTYWAEYDDANFKSVIYALGEKKIKFGLTTPESITRVRRKLHAEGKFRPTVDVFWRRKEKQGEVRKYFSEQAKLEQE